MSILATIIFLLFAAGRLVRLVTLSNPYKFKNTVYHNLERDLGRRAARELAFDYAVVIYNSETA